MKPVCAVVGVGPGNGAALARHFSAAGYAVALLARGTGFTQPLAAELPDARALACDAGDPAWVTATFRSLGDVDVVVWNAGSGAWGTVEEITPDDLERAFRVNTVGALAALQAVLPGMKARGGGSFVFIGATASRRGGPRSAAFAPAKAAQRALAESMARHLWPQGIHVSLIVVDGVVDLPSTRQRMPDQPDDFFVEPEGVAETALQLVRQRRSAWSFEVEARPFKERW